MTVQPADRTGEQLGGDAERRRDVLEMNRAGQLRRGSGCAAEAADERPQADEQPLFPLQVK